jgi:hypothetical protein
MTTTDLYKVILLDLMRHGGLSMVSRSDCRKPLRKLWSI